MNLNINVSIIVPVYNVELYIKECIDSLINQTLKNIQIILVNDGSTDSSGEICKDYSKSDKRIIYIEQTNSGQSSARNNGLKEAKGEYILFVDSDDYLDLRACEVLYNKAKEYNLDIVHGDILNDYEIMNKDLNYRYIDSENLVISGIDYLKESIKYNNYDIVVFLYFIKREYLILHNLKFIEGCFYEDQDYTLKLLTASFNNRFMKIRYPYYFYRSDREGSTTNSVSIKKCSDFITILSSMNNYILKINDEKNKKIMLKILSLTYYHMSQVWIKLNKEDREKIIDILNKNKYLKTNSILNNYPTKKIVLQNYLFTYFPNLLYMIYKFKNKGRMK
ncbi:glycosyltransferase [Clostridium perfringens]